MMRRRQRLPPPSDDQFLTGPLFGGFSPAPLLRSAKRRTQAGTVRGDCAGLPEGGDMRSSSLSFGLPARLALLALTIGAAIALGGFPGLESHSGVATAAGGVTRT